MNSIFKLIAFPITLIIGILSFLIILSFGGLWNKDDTVELNFVRINREAQYLFISEKWNDIYPFFKALIACVIYWYLFF